MLINDLLKKAKARLGHIENAGLDTYILLSHVLSIANWQQLTLMGNKTINNKQVDEFNGLIARREKHEPIALIIGYKEFWSLDFKVTADTLIPRPETELIIESVLQYFPSGKYNMLDLGSGSGCLIITLLHEYKNSYGMGVDISSKALKVAQDNAVQHGVADRVNFILSNWLDEVPEQKFDIIVSNPPYISLREMSDLKPNVIEFEPHSALTDFSDGLQHYRAMISAMHRYMHPETIAFIEFGIGQGDAIAALLSHHGYIVVERKNDLAGIERAIIFQSDQSERPHIRICTLLHQ